MPLERLTDDLVVEIAREFPTLSNLNLSKNAIREIDCDFSLLRHVNRLNLSHNQLDDLPATLHAHLPQLTQLLLAHNKFTSLQSLQSLKTITHLDLSANAIDHLDQLDYLKDLPLLSDLSLHSVDQYIALTTDPQLMQHRIHALQEILTLQETELSHAVVSATARKQLSHVTPDPPSMYQKLLAKWRTKVFEMVVAAKCQDMASHELGQQAARSVHIMETRVADHVRHIQSLTQRLADADAAARLLHLQLDQLHADRTTLQSKCQRHVATVESERQRMREMAHHVIASVQDTIRDLERTLALQTNAHAHVETQLAEVRAQSATADSAWRTQVRELELKLDSVSREHDKAMARLEEAHAMALQDAALQVRQAQKDQAKQDVYIRQLERQLKRLQDSAVAQEKDELQALGRQLEKRYV
ncbi:hypothetical protein DYB31_003608 [Aphanomyces astaci]|uniref:Uncharacterized protein n=1 Tax=Aphanomyces astaci TaxID=112090 RepID=A0A397EF33_APHAT|nr:hypothetical protein DYB31_003608 [Aphanomyces astaci]